MMNTGSSIFRLFDDALEKKLKMHRKANYSNSYYMKLFTLLTLSKVIIFFWKHSSKQCFQKKKQNGHIY